MALKLNDWDRMREEEYQAMLNSLGGQFPFFKRWQMGGTGLGGLTLQNEQALPLPRLHNESWICSLEQLRKGIIFRCTNSKKWYIAPIPFDHISNIAISNRKNTQLDLVFSTHLKLRFVFNGWAGRQIRNYFNKVPEIELEMK